MKTGYVYMLLTLPTFRVKVGMTSNLKNRCADISESLPSQIAVPVMVIFSADYVDIEAHIHSVFDFCRYEYKGSGKSEYFRTIVSPVIFLYMVVIQILRVFKTLAYVAAFGFAIWLVFQIITK